MTDTVESGAVLGNGDPHVDHNVALQSIQVTEAAALVASRHVGRGDDQAAEEAAVEATHRTLQPLKILGRVAIGPGGQDETLALHQGEAVGTGQGLVCDIAVKPVEGANIVARGGSNAMAILAIAQPGAFLNVPDLHMNKIAIGPGFPPDVVHLDRSPAENLHAMAAAKNCAVSDLLACVLDRPRHRTLVAQIRAAGACIRLIPDGDVTAIIATAEADTGYDIYFGTGGAREGVVAAAALRGFGGFMQSRLVIRTEDQLRQARACGIDDPDRLYTIDMLAGGDVVVVATGITDGPALDGVRRFPNGATTHSLLVRSLGGPQRFIRTRHDFTREIGFEALDR